MSVLKRIWNHDLFGLGVFFVIGFLMLGLGMAYDANTVTARETEPSYVCRPVFQWAEDANGGRVCMAMCWGGSTRGGPAMTWVPDKHCPEGEP